MHAINKVCKKYMGIKYNYIIAIYYSENLHCLGETKAIVYSNKYINYLKFGTKYIDQDHVNKLCPEYIKNIENVPIFFKNMISNI